MAQHSIILSESEYEELKGRGGCFTGCLVTIGIIIMLIYGGVSGCEGDEKDAANEEVVADEEVVSPDATTLEAETPVEYGSSNERVEEPIVEPVVASEVHEEQPAPASEESEDSAPSVEEPALSVEEPKAESQEEPQLSRKERRALRRAQKKAEKEERKRREMEEENE
jgi:type IV secretory pathway VirB10-like protein